MGCAGVAEPDLQTMTCIRLCPSYPYDEPHLAHPYGLLAFADPRPTRKATLSREAVDPNVYLARQVMQHSSRLEKNVSLQAAHGIIQYRYCHSRPDNGRERRANQKSPDQHSLPQHLSRLNQIRQAPPTQKSNAPQNNIYSFIVTRQQHVNNLPRKPRFRGGGLNLRPGFAMRWRVGVDRWPISAPIGPTRRP